MSAPEPAAQICMIAYASHDQAAAFVQQMAALADTLMPGSAYARVVTTKDVFLLALQTQAVLTVVSVHGPEEQEPAPVIGDGTDANRIGFRELGASSLSGARAGIIWDACHLAREAFRTEFARLSRPDVVHIAPAGKIEWDDSVHLAETMLSILLASGSPPITPAAASAAAAKTADSSAIGLEYWRAVQAQEAAL
jgi:hypothetical protein